MVTIETYNEVENALNETSKRLKENYLKIQPIEKCLECDELTFFKRLMKAFDSIEYLKEEQIFTLKIKPDE